LKKIILILIIITLFSSNLFAQNLRNSSISFDPISLIGLVWFFSEDENQMSEIDFNNIWFGMDINWETKSHKEMSVGFFIGTHQVALKTQFRSFLNKENQSGLFWGLYGLIDWRRMDWVYDENNELSIAWISSGSNNVYYSIGITGGINIGFRFRSGSSGITPFVGLGIPLFFCFGNLPPQNNINDFYIANTIIRTINIGINIDLFTYDR